MSAKMVRHHRPSPLGRLALVWTCSWCCMLLLRHNGGGVTAQTSNGDDDVVTGSNDDASTNDCDASSTEMIGDALCDFDLNVAACGFDGGDCCECTCIDTDEQACGEGGAGYFCLDPDAPQDCGPTGSPTPSPSSLETSSASSSDTSTTYPGCGGYLAHMGDGFCDEDLNNAACGFDGGDCCACTCGAGASTGSDSLEHSCGQAGDGYDCRDPNVPDDCGVTPSPAASFGYPDCTGYLYDWQDSYCDSDLNNAACGYDGGDCCRCTCREYSSWSTTCGYYGFDCMDPEAPSKCSTDSPTPSPASGTDYPQCEGTIYSIADGFCQSYNNNEECDWDGGDCCPCTCEDSGFYYSSCGYYGYDCLDPTVSTDCSPAPTPSPTLSPYPECLGTVSFIGDSDCDSYNNNEECDWDGGDCCPCTCDGSGSYYSLCGSIYDCLDPTVSTDCLPDPTPSPTLSPYYFCTGNVGYIADGDCDSSNNNEECGWDGGDCCPCTCDDTGSLYACGDYDCLDPTVSTDCITTSTQYNYGDTYDDGAYCPYSGDGKCDSGYNTEACDWDGGDCCECDCISSSYSCGIYGYNCLDSASTCTSSSSAAIPVDQQQAWATITSTSEPSLTNAEIVGIIALSAWGFCMLGCGLFAACGLGRRTCFKDEKDGATGGSIQPRGRLSRPSDAPLAASVAAAAAAAAAVPPKGTDQTNTGESRAASQSSQRGVDHDVEESKGAENAKMDPEPFSVGCSKGVGEVEREDPSEADDPGGFGDEVGDYDVPEGGDVGSGAGAADAAHDDVVAGASDGGAGDSVAGATGKEEENTGISMEEISDSTHPAEEAAVAGGPAEEAEPPGGDGTVGGDGGTAKPA